MTTPALADAITNAARNAVVELFRERPNDTFYYISLITTGEGHSPCLTAWSWEKLAETVQAEGGNDQLTADLKWSYADSPFYCFGESYFNVVKQLFNSRSTFGDRDSTSDGCELDLRLKGMEAAMATLDAEGLFGVGTERFGIVINAEVMPPDHSNVERAKRLNPPEALGDWLREAAEPV